jgi:phytanoyl-CoA hydroxylase
VADLLPSDVAVTVPILSGDCTVHNERILHGSGGNSTSGLRRAWVLAFRREETIRIERERGFTHSHNDEPDVLAKVGTNS